MTIKIGHARISENNNSGRDGNAKAGDQTKREVCVQDFYKKPWVYLLRVKDHNLAEKMAKACETICANDCVGYDQLNRLTLNKELKKLNYDYTKLQNPCECDCSSFMTVCAQCAGIDIPYPSGNAPTTSNMVKIFEGTGYFDVITDSIFINAQENLLRGDILVGKPATHTVMVLGNGAKATAPVKSKKTIEEVVADVLAGKYGNGSARKQKIEAEGFDYKEVQSLVNKILKG